MAGSSQVAGRAALDLFVERVDNPTYAMQVFGGRVIGGGGSGSLSAAAAAASASRVGMRGPMCRFEPEDAKFLEGQGGARNKPKSYIVVNEPRSGSSWLQEISQMHPGIKVQFELDLNKGDDALSCRECKRPRVPDSKYLHRIPPKQHPPGACGMTIFASSNPFSQVAELAARHSAVLIILVRINHVAHAVSIYRHFNKPPLPRHFASASAASSRSIEYVPWDANELAYNVDECQQTYDRLLKFPEEVKRPAHILFYEDLKSYPDEVWASMQEFLGLERHRIEDLENLEKKSTKKPSIFYLQNLPQLQQQLKGEEWIDMLRRPDYDDGINVTAHFEEACRRHPTATMSWRLHECRNGAAVPRGQVATEM